MNRKVVLIGLLSLFVLLTSCTREVKTKDEKQKTEIALVIHGGAGDISAANISPEKEAEYKQKLNEALIEGYKILKDGGSSVDAVEKVIKILENSPLFNAGKGSVLTTEKKFEMDAAIMDGRTLKTGAVTGVSHIKNPISAARLIMDNSQNVFFSGAGAEQYVKSQGMDLVDSLYFYPDDVRAEIEKKNLEEQNKKNKQSKKKSKKRFSFVESESSFTKYGTVGCIALDKDGNLAAGTSTGGLENKMKGRIGDTPIIGAGTYANNNTCAVSCTGQGEYFIRGVVAYDMSALLEYKGMSLATASNYVIKVKMNELGGLGGLIALDKYGNISMNFNTKGMFRGFITDKGKPEVKIFND